MRKPMVAGNWKMHGTKNSCQQLIASLLNFDLQGATEVAIFPPYVFLAEVENLLADKSIAFGAQDVAAYSDGAYTGEISASMLKDFGCRFVIVGHSERRTIFNESNEIIAQKFQMAGKIGIKPILCVGETLDERNANETEQVIANQLRPVLENPQNFSLLENALIAYEPVWAIGTGVTATPNQAQKIHEKIRQMIAEYDKNLSQKVRILYGGSVKQSNASDLFAMPDIDGGLIGGASLDANEFSEIVKICNNYY